MKITIKSLHILGSFLEMYQPADFFESRSVVEIFDQIKDKFIKHSLQLNDIQMKIADLEQGKAQLRPKDGEVGSEAYLKLVSRLNELKKEKIDTEKKKVTIDLDNSETADITASDVMEYITKAFKDKRFNSVETLRSINKLFKELDEA